MSAAVKFGVLAFLAVVALAYFALIAWRAATLADVLLRRGWRERGWNEQRLTLGLRVLGWGGVFVSAGAIALAIYRIIR